MTKVKTQDIYGYLSPSGEFHVLPDYKFCGNFSEGLASFTVESLSGTKIGFLDPEFNVVIAPRFTYVTPFKNGCSTVTFPGSGITSTINKKGEVLNSDLDNKLNAKSDFNLEERLIVKKIDKTYGPPEKKMVSVPGPWELDEKGNRLYLKYVTEERTVSEEFLHPYYLLTDLNSHPVTDRKFHSLFPAKEGLFCAEGDDGWGFVDKDGNEVIPLNLQGAYDFSEGLAFVKMEGNFGYIDKMGEVVIKPRFVNANELSGGDLEISSFQNGFVFFAEKGTKLGIMNKKGEVVVPPKFDGARPFSCSIAAVKIGKSWGYINDQGKMILDCNYTRVGDFSEGRGFFVTDHGFFLIDIEGKTCSEAFKLMGPMINGWASVFKQVEMTKASPKPDLSKQRKAFLDEKTSATKLPFVQIREKLILKHKKTYALPGAARKAASSEFLKSSIGGLPYLEQDKELPRDSNNRPLVLLAQINFAEMPSLDGFPKEGILQFFISQNSILMAEAENQKVIFIEEPIEKKIVPSKVAEALEGISCTDEFSINLNWYEIAFTKDSGFMSVGDFRFEKLLGKEGMEIYRADDKLGEAYYKKTKCSGHKIGGYAAHLQNDPRTADSKETILLLQVMTDKIIDTESGYFALFISPEDLTKKDFSKVLVNYECT